MTGRPYISSQDSELIRRAVQGATGAAALDMGAGNGGGLAILAPGFPTSVGTDLVRPAMDDWRESGANFVLADRASCFREGVFDLVILNPPYLPSESVKDVAVDGGADGTEVPLRFLSEAMRVVTDDGRLLMLVSNLNRIDLLEEECARRGFSMRLVDRESLFYERLYVYELSKAKGRPGVPDL